VIDDQLTIGRDDHGIVDTGQIGVSPKPRTGSRDLLRIPADNSAENARIAGQHRERRRIAGKVAKQARRMHVEAAAQVMLQLAEQRVFRMTAHQPCQCDDSNNKGRSYQEHPSVEANSRKKAF